MTETCPVCQRAFTTTQARQGHLYGYTDTRHVEYRLTHGLPVLHCTVARSFKDVQPCKP